MEEAFGVAEYRTQGRGGDRAGEAAPSHMLDRGTGTTFWWQEGATEGQSDLQRWVVWI